MFNKLLNKLSPNPQVPLVVSFKSQRLQTLASKMIRFILLQNRQGKTRLAKYYVPLEDSEKHKVEYEIHRLVVNRDPKFTNFVELAHQASFNQAVNYGNLQAQHNMENVVVKKVFLVEGEVAKLFADAGVICIASLISPYRVDRDACHKLLPEGNIIEVFMDIPKCDEECEARDPKGLYKLARDGKIKGFTGIDDPYEKPLNCEIVLQQKPGECSSPCSMAETVVSYN